jgi:hypothetical protein
MTPTTGTLGQHEAPNIEPATAVAPPVAPRSRPTIERSPGPWDTAGVRTLIALLAFPGAALLIASELIDRLERIEGDAVMIVLNLIFALPIATLVVCTAALAGDSLLSFANRRTGRRPGARLITPFLTISGAISTAAIAIGHLGHPPAFAAYVGLGGSFLLLLAALTNHLRRREPPRLRQPR